MEEKEKDLPIRATVTFESAEMQRRVRRYTVDKMCNLREQSKAINLLLDRALKLEGY